MLGHLQGKVRGQFDGEVIHPKAGTAHQPLNLLRLAPLLRSIPGILRFAVKLRRLRTGKTKSGKPPQHHRNLKAE